MGSPIQLFFCDLAVAGAVMFVAACGADPAGDDPLGDAPAGDPALADVVVDGLAADPDETMLAINGVRGKGDLAGSEDVLRLGYEPGVDNAVTLRWSDRRVLNGAGDDFVVFENAFLIAGGAGHFMDPAVIELSEDGTTWVPFPHDYRAPDETVYSDDPGDWCGFAGLQPVRLHAEDNPVDPFDAAAAGGDHFDLDALAADGGPAESIRRDGFVYLRLVTAPTRLNPETGLPFPRDAVATGADLDGVYARWLEPAP